MSAILTPRRWVEFFLEKVPIGSGTNVYKWSTRPIAGNGIFVEGRVPVDGAQTIRRSASALTGEPSIDDASLVLLDTDGVLRSLLDEMATHWFINRDAAFKMLSEAGWNAGLAPRLLFGGKCVDIQLQDNRRVAVQFQDLLAPYLDRTYPQYTLGNAYPYRFANPDPGIDATLNTADPGYQIPIELRDQVIPIYYGPFIDTATDPVTGLPRQKGMIPTYFMGYSYLTAGTGTVGEPTPEQAALMAPFQTTVGWGGWGELVVGLGEQAIPNVYVSNLAESPKRILLTADRYGMDVIAPGHPNWPFATNYVMRNGYRITVIYARGPVLWQHITGIVNITVDVCGWPSAIAPFNSIDQAGSAWQDFITQHVLANDGRGYTSGPSVGLPTYADGRAKFWTSKIQAWQAMTADRLGTAKGYLVSMALTKPTSLRDIRQTFNITFASLDAQNAAGQLFLFGVNDLADPTTGAAVREHIELQRLPAPTLDWRAIENSIDYVYGWDPEQDKPRTITLNVKAQEYIDALKDVRKSPGTKQLIYTSDDATATDSIGRQLLLLRDAPRYQPLPVGVAGVGREIGDQLRVSHRDGFGPPGVGYLNRVMLTLQHTHEAAGVTLTALEIDGLLRASSRWVGDSAPNWSAATEAQRASSGFWTDDNGMVSGVSNVSEWR